MQIIWKKALKILIFPKKVMYLLIAFLSSSIKNYFTVLESTRSVQYAN